MPQTTWSPFQLRSWTFRYPDMGVLTPFAVSRWFPKNMMPMLFPHWKSGLFFLVNRSTCSPHPCAISTAGENRLSSTDLSTAEETAPKFPKQTSPKPRTSKIFRFRVKSSEFIPEQTLTLSLNEKKKKHKAHKLYIHQCYWEHTSSASTGELTIAIAELGEINCGPFFWLTSKLHKDLF